MGWRVHGYLVNVYFLKLFAKLSQDSCIYHTFKCVQVKNDKVYKALSFLFTNVSFWTTYISLLT